MLYKQRRTPSNSGRQRNVVAWVVAIGVVASFAALAVHVRFENERGLADLSQRGLALSSLLMQVGNEAAVQTEAAAALFEVSTEVDNSDFSAFAARTFTEPVSSIVFLRKFGPESESLSSYVYRRDAPDQGDDWQATFSAGIDGIGLGVGDFLSEYEDGEEVVGRAITTRELSSLPFARVVGDDEPGDTLLAAPVRNRSNELTGMVLSSVQFDEILQDAIGDQPQLEWFLSPTDPARLGTIGPSLWFQSVQLADSQIWLVGMREMASIGFDSWAVLVAALAATGLLASLFKILESNRRFLRDAQDLRQAAHEKDRFLAGIGHALRTPLTAVLGMLDMLVVDAGSLTPVEFDEFMSTAWTESRRLADIVDRFLIVDRINADMLTIANEVTDLDSILSNVLDRVANSKPIRLTRPERAGTLVTDPLRLRQLLLNLLENAYRHAKTVVEISVARNPGEVHLNIANDGDPPPADLAERYKSGSEAGQPDRLGIGLWLANELATRMGGNLTHVRRGERTIFTLCLPESEPAGPRASGDNETKSVRLRSVTIPDHHPRTRTPVR